MEIRLLACTIIAVFGAGGGYLIWHDYQAAGRGVKTTLWRLAENGQIVHTDDLIGAAFLIGVFVLVAAYFVVTGYEEESGEVRLDHVRSDD